MTNDVATKSKKEMKVTYESNGEPITLTANMVTNFITNGNGKISQKEVVMFLKLCQFQHLNPFLNEAYLIKFGDKPAQIITSKEAFMKRANANKHYQGFKAGIIVDHNGEMKQYEGTVMLPSDKLIGGWCKVYRDDFSEPIYQSVSVSEFSKSQATWRTMPATMIRKTAIVNALREAFPQDLGGMYTEDDKNLNEAKDVTPDNVNTEPATDISQIIGKEDSKDDNSNEAKEDSKPKQTTSAKAKPEPKQKAKSDSSKEITNAEEQSLFQNEPE